MKALDSIWEISVYSFVVRRSRVLCPGEQVAAAGRDALHLRLCVLTGAEGAVEGLPRIGDYGHAVVLRRACTPRARRSHQASALERRDVGSSAPGLYSMQVPSGPGRRGMPDKFIVSLPAKDHRTLLINLVRRLVYYISKITNGFRTLPLFGRHMRTGLHLAPVSTPSTPMTTPPRVYVPNSQILQVLRFHSGYGYPFRV